MSTIGTARNACADPGAFHYQLNTPYRDGTTHVIFEPLDLIARLAVLIPRPRANLTRFHGVFVGVPHQPNSKHRAFMPCGYWWRRRNEARAPNAR